MRVTAVVTSPQKSDHARTFLLFQDLINWLLGLSMAAAILVVFWLIYQTGDYFRKMVTERLKRQRRFFAHGVVGALA